MPFTFTHPAVVIPIYHYVNRSLSLSALIIGSMAPDFVYFFLFSVTGALSHSP
ncbi:TPA: DUF4184 family protein [Citrobacter freundii]|nr:DUF4184 family protein [Citrobacter freundii]